MDLLLVCTSACVDFMVIQSSLIQALNDLTDETDRMQTLTSSLLELAHRESSPNIMNETVDLSTLLLDLSDSLRPVVEAKGLTFQCNVSEGLTLKADSDGLLRLFANLLNNAIQYTQHGEIKLSAGRESNKTLRVTVADTGCGLAPEYLPHNLCPLLPRR